MGNSKKSALGKKNKKAREIAANLLSTLKGVSVRDATNKQKEDLLIIILQLLGLVDEDGVIK